MPACFTQTTACCLPLCRGIGWYGATTCLFLFSRTLEANSDLGELLYIIYWGLITVLPHIEANEDCEYMGKGCRNALSSCSALPECTADRPVSVVWVVTFTWLLLFCCFTLGCKLCVFCFRNCSMFSTCFVRCDRCWSSSEHRFVSLCNAPSGSVGLLIVYMVSQS